MTPTFAVGLGVVIAAAIAFQTPRSVLRYGGPPADPGLPCPVVGCQSVTGKGVLASAKPGTRLLSPARTGPVQAREQASGVQPPAAAGGSRSPVTVQYQTLTRNGRSDFTGQLAVTGRHPASWVLQFSYPDGQLTTVWGGMPEPHDAHTATVRAARYTADWSGQPGIQIMFTVLGPAGPPVTCTFDGQPCRLARSPQRR
jgi:hypothetical protein